jgi:hypothetical protein
MNKRKNESGQSILIIALVVLVLLALIALVVDVGNAYAHRRMVQNAVDAAAMAGARMLAFRGSTEPLEDVRHIEVARAVYDFAEKNGLKREAVRPWFIENDGDPAELLPTSYEVVDPAIVGVGVEADLPFDTYFAHLLGFPTMQATADAAAYHITGPCNGECLFPVIVSQEHLESECEVEKGKYCVLWEQTQLAPGNFGWLYWVTRDGEIRGDPPQGPEVPTLERNLTPDECYSGEWSDQDWVHGNVGVNFQPVLDLLEQYITDESPVTIPIYAAVEGEGNNAVFDISGFGRFVLICAHASRAHYTSSCLGEEATAALQELEWPSPDKDNNKYLIGKFVDDELTYGFGDGCIETGVSGVSFRPPKSLWMPEWREDD